MNYLRHALLFVFISTSCHQFISASLIPLTTVCDQRMMALCDGLGNHVVCYDGRHYANMCVFMQAACNNQTRPNISVPTTGNGCELSVVIQTHSVVTTTESTVSAGFESVLFANAIHGIDDLLLRANHSGASLDEQKKIFSVQNHTGKDYRRSTNCWAYPLDLTMISPWNSNLQNRKAGVLVTPRHALWAKHYNMPVGTTLRFIDHENNVIDRRIVKSHAVPHNVSGSTNSGYDIMIGELDRDVPNSISYAKVFPRDLSVIRPPTNTPVPVFGTDFEEKALVANLYIESGNMVSLRLPKAGTIRKSFYETKITGDSGNPVFMVLDNEPVLLFMLTFGGSGSGTSVTYHFDALNEIIRSWGSDHQLKEKDLIHFIEAGNSMPHVIG